MKQFLTILFTFLIAICASAQENPVLPGSTAEQQLENLTEQQESETEDDAYLQALVQLRKNPLNLNIAERNELRDLRMLSDLQIEKLLQYRQLLGALLSIYELQAVPAWDLETIQKVLPYVYVGSAVPLKTDLQQRFTGGQHSMLVRLQQVLEQSNGYLRPDSVANRYLGSPQRVFFRYKYVYRNLLQFGLTGDKDAGEQFFKGKQSNGFDFYSFHLFARKLGAIKLLALGDFTVNMGQGLIQWQSLAFKKSVDISAVKRQADVLRPYNSAAEYNFQRGAGITLGLKHFDITAFGSVRQVDANFNQDTTQTSEDYISSVLSTGYHRTPAEILKKNTISQTSFGGNVSYNNNGLHLGLNAVDFKFSVPLIKNVQPYNQYAIQGKDWYNYSFDYSYTYRNMHLFGEAALDKTRSKALLAGLLASLDRTVDLSLVYRNIEKSYQALYANAFTEGTYPTNEKGLFAGLSIKPVAYLKIDGYADIFSFPWLRYRVDAPSTGSEYLLQLTYKPNKQVEVYTRFRNENKAINISGLSLPARLTVVRPRQNWRTNISYSVSREVTLRNRVEVLWFDAREKDRSQQGFLTYFEGRYKPLSKPYAVNARLQYFETDGYESRLYAFENDVLYSFSIPQFIGKGLRYYLNFNVDLSRKTTIWLRWAQTIYADRSVISSGLDEILSNKRSEVKLQLMHNF